MNKKIIFKDAEGNTCVVHPAPHIKDLETLKTKVVPSDATSVQVVDAEVIPKDRYFRNAWDIQQDKVVEDRKKCEDIHMDKIRAVRNKKLEELDQEVIKNIANLKELKKIEAKKQVLRDIPQTLDLSKAKTLNDLKALRPIELS